MKSSVILIDLILILVIFIPYVLFIRAGKKESGRFRNAIRNILKARDLAPGIEEHWNSRYIGIDTGKHSLIFIQLNNGLEAVNVIDLRSVHSCSLIRSLKPLRTRKGKEEVLTQLGIELTYNKPGKPHELLTFYDSEEHFEAYFEAARGEKWVRLISEQLPVKTPVRTAV